MNSSLLKFFAIEYVNNIADVLFWKYVGNNSVVGTIFSE